MAAAIACLAGLAVVVGAVFLLGLALVPSANDGFAVVEEGISAK